MLTTCLAAIALLQLIESPPRTERLDNGLRVVIVEDHTLPLVSVQLWYRVGSAYDDPKNPGLCHVARTILEHRHDAALRLRAAGVRFESHTLRDACYFTLVLPPNFLEYVLKIEAGRMRSVGRVFGLFLSSRPAAPPSAAPEPIARALAAAARDYGLSPDDPEQLAQRQLLAAMFPPDHPYRHPPGLVAESLSGLEPDDVDEFLQRWFVPGNATLFIIGDVSDVSAMQLVRQHFAPLPWAEPPRRAELPSPEAAQIHLPTLPAEQTAVDIAWLTPPAGYFENAALDVLMHRLCNPVDGPLYLRLTEAGCPPPRWCREAWRDHGLLVLSVDWPEQEGNEATRQRGNKGSVGVPPAEGSVGVSAGRVDRLQTGPTADVAAGPRTGRSAPTSTPEQIELAIREELTRAADTIPSEIELNRARSLAARDVMLRRASFSKRALRLAWYETVAGDLLLADFERPRVTGANVADVQEAAALLLRARTIVRPRQRSSESKDNTATHGVAGLTPPLNAEPPTQLDSAAALGLLAKHAKDAPPVKSPASPATVTTHELDNGVRITVCSVPGLEPAGVRTLLTAPESLWESLGALMAVGSTRRSVDQIRDYLSYHGLDILPLVHDPRSGLDSYGPASRVGQMIELQGELIRYADRSEARCAAATERLRSVFTSMATTQRRLRRNAYYLPPTLIGWHMLANVICPEASRVRAKLEQLVTISGVELLVVGDVEPDQVVGAARAVWADWEPAPPRAPRREFRAPWTETQPNRKPWTTVSWIDWRTAPVGLSVSDRLAAPVLDPAVRELTLHCAACLLGVPQHLSTGLDSDHAWLWSWKMPTDRWFMYSATPNADDLASTFEVYLGHLDDLRLGKLSEKQVEIALRLARVERVVTLAGPTAIADLLERGVANPWDLLDEREAREFAELVPREYRVRTRALNGLGPQDRTSEIERFKHVPDDLWPPGSP